MSRPIPAEWAAEAHRRTIAAGREAVATAVEDVMGSTMGEIVAALRRDPQQSARCAACASLPLDFAARLDLERARVAADERARLDPLHNAILTTVAGVAVVDVDVALEAVGIPRHLARPSHGRRVRAVLVSLGYRRGAVDGREVMTLGGSNE